jgi:2-polyprenyl-6-methoxyphenol hydroxylase-like FAD-dependent oxidoreductase
MIDTGAIIVGASAAGLATSACLTRKQREHVLLEASDGLDAVDIARAITTA